MAIEQMQETAPSEHQEQTDDFAKIEKLQEQIRAFADDEKSSERMSETVVAAGDVFSRLQTLTEKASLKDDAPDKYAGLLEKIKKLNEALEGTGIRIEY